LSSVDTGPLPAAVLFDLDGTLINSEPAWREALQKLASKRGTVLTEEILFRARGLEVAQAMRLLYEMLKWSGGDPQEDLELVHAHVTESFRRRLPWQPGARRLIDETASAGIATGLVTSTYRALVDVILNSIPGTPFRTVVCGDDVTMAKPHPEPYLRAVSELGCQAAHCVAIEDSAVGGDSAREAGCLVLMVGPSSVTAGADLGVEDLSHVSLGTLSRLVAGDRWAGTADRR
jgi:HAD superfamily hydrolase (TIGR01509 family)